MGQPAEKRPRATYADLEAVPPGKVAELIDGELYVFPRPAFPHLNAESALTELLRGALRDQRASDVAQRSNRYLPRQPERSPPASCELRLLACEPRLLACEPRLSHQTAHAHGWGSFRRICPSPLQRVRGPRVNLLLFAAEPDPSGLALGRFPAPAWVIWVVSAVVVLGAITFLVIRARRSKASRRDGR
jgi:hypothetical protein